MAEGKGWKLIATRGTGYYLVVVEPGIGRVLHPGGFAEEQPLESILKWGYWEESDDQGPLEAALKAGAPIEQSRRIDRGNTVPA